MGDYVTTEMLNGLADECSFRPLGQARWGIEVADSDDEGQIEITLEHWTYNARTFEHWDEFFEAEIHPQTFATIVARPLLDDDAEQFKFLLLELCVGALAHEGCEWFQDEVDGIIHDPHMRGEPSVHIG